MCACTAATFYNYSAAASYGFACGRHNLSTEAAAAHVCIPLKLMNCWLFGEQYLNLLQLKMMTLKCLKTFCFSATLFQLSSFC